MDTLTEERIALEKEYSINPIEYALKWESLARKFEAEGRVGAAMNCMFRAQHYAEQHAQTQNVRMN